MEKLSKTKRVTETTLATCLGEERCRIGRISERNGERHLRLDIVECTVRGRQGNDGRARSEHSDTKKCNHTCSPYLTRQFPSLSNDISQFGCAA